MSSSKARFVEAKYVSAVSYDIKEVEKDLGISWKDVEEFWVKWCRLFIRMKDGTLHEVYGEPSDVDWKRPFKTNLLDDTYTVIE